MVQEHNLREKGCQLHQVKDQGSISKPSVQASKDLELMFQLQQLIAKPNALI